MPAIPGGPLFYPLRLILRILLFQTRVNFSSPSFSITVVSLSPALSHTCFSGGMPKITPSGVPVKRCRRASG